MTLQPRALRGDPLIYNVEARKIPSEIWIRGIKTHHIAKRFFLQIIAEKSNCKCSIFVVCLKWLFCLCQLAVDVGGKVVCFFENFFEGSCSFSGLFSSAVKDCRTQLYLRLPTRARFTLPVD